MARPKKRVGELGFSSKMLMRIGSWNSQTAREAMSRKVRGVKAYLVNYRSPHGFLGSSGPYDSLEEAESVARRYRGRPHVHDVTIISTRKSGPFLSDEEAAVYKSLR